jgi:hypothetical protein
MATLNYTPNSELVSSKQTWEIPYAVGGGGGGANTAPATGSNGSGVWVPYEITIHTTGEGGSTGKGPVVVAVLTTLEIIELLKEAIEAWDAPAALKSLAERIHKQPYGTEQQAWLALIEAASEHAISL